MTTTSARTAAHRLLAALFVATVWTITSLGSSPSAHAWYSDSTMPDNSFRFVLEDHEIKDLKSFDLAPGTLCQEQLIPEAQRQGKSWLDHAACMDEPYTCAIKAGEAGIWMATMDFTRRWVESTPGVWWPHWATDVTCSVRRTQ